jgi:tRNA G37 N-methylase TrmD
MRKGKERHGVTSSHTGQTHGLNLQIVFLNSKGATFAYEVAKNVNNYKSIVIVTSTYKNRDMNILNQS